MLTISHPLHGNERLSDGKETRIDYNARITKVLYWYKSLSFLENVQLSLLKLETSISTEKIFSDVFSSGGYPTKLKRGTQTLEAPYISNDCQKKKHFFLLVSFLFFFILKKKNESELS